MEERAIRLEDSTVHFDISRAELWPWVLLLLRVMLRGKMRAVLAGQHVLVIKD